MGGNARGMVDVEAPAGSGSFTVEASRVDRMGDVATTGISCHGIV
jgi:hypothetical protein